MSGAKEPAPRVAVFEISNETRREFYLCVSPLPLAELTRRHCDAPPPAAAHWKRGEKISYREVESDLEPGAAAAFLKHYATALAATTWKVLTDPKP